MPTVDPEEEGKKKKKNPYKAWPNLLQQGKNLFLSDPHLKQLDIPWINNLVSSCLVSNRMPLPLPHSNS